MASLVVHFDLVQHYKKLSYSQYYYQSSIVDIVLDLLSYYLLCDFLTSKMATPALIDQSKSQVEKDSHERSIPASELASESTDSGYAEKLDPEYGSYPDHVFANEQVAEHWREVYEKAHYEGRHRFDPELTWTAEEEKKLR